MNQQIQPPQSAPLFDPWSPEFIADPYPYYRRLRATEPIHLTPLGFHIVSRHADVAAILRDKRFGKDFIGRITRRSGPKIFEEPVYRSMSHWMLQLDPPDHGRLRGLVVQAFTARRVQDMRPRIQQIVDEIIDHLKPMGRMDVIADFAFRLPVTVICDMLVPRSSSPYDDSYVPGCKTALPTFTLQGISDRFGRFKHPVAQAVEHYEIARYGTLKTWRRSSAWIRPNSCWKQRSLRKKRLTRPSRNLRKTKSTSTLRLPEAAAATDSVVLDPSTKPRRTKSREASFFATRTQKRFQSGTKLSN